MLIQAEVKQGKITKELDFLHDGNYLFVVLPMKDKTDKDFLKHYFTLIDTISFHTGEDRYSIHERFKAENKTETTKNFNSQQWTEFIQLLKYDALAKYDICI